MRNYYNKGGPTLLVNKIRLPPGIKEKNFSC